MDTRQYGPALFATVKQVRSLLDEGAPPAHARHDSGGEETPGEYDDPRDGRARAK
jgi:hypothetical protein